MTDLNLYRVTVTQEWSVEGEALVWATSPEEAEKAAELEVELNPDDAEAIGPFSRSAQRPVEEAMALTPAEVARRGLWLIDSAGNTVDLDDFQAVLSAEQLEAMRLARTEAGNGQLALLEVA